MITCGFCKKKFEPSRTNNIYCSRKCRDSNVNTKCLNCGKIYKSQSYEKGLCSKKCRSEHYLKKYPPRSEKKCNYCSEVKNYSLFRVVKPLTKGLNKGKFVGWRTVNNDYRASRCLNCEKNEFQIRYEKNPFPQMRSNAKIRAKADGKVFNVSTEYIKSIFPKDSRCPVLGVKFDMRYKKGATNKYAPSLDKIIPEKGYVEGNLIVVSMIVNRLKSDANYDDMEKILKYYLKNKNFNKYFYEKKK